MNYNDDFREKLNLDDLYSNKKEEFQGKIKVYQNLLARVHRKIKHTSRQRNNDCYCFYVIPEFIFGIPKYDVAACTSYIIQKLQENGFQTKYTYPNLLFISWKHYIPDYERRRIKEQTGMKIDGFGNLISKKNHENSDDPNALMLKDKDSSGGKKKGILKNKNYKSVDSYQPGGKLIYSNDIIKSINDISKK